MNLIFVLDVSFAKISSQDIHWSQFRPCPCSVLHNVEGQQLCQSSGGQESSTKEESSAGSL